MVDTCTNDDPGAVIYGNFKYYYKFNPVEERIKLLPIEILPKPEKLIALDIGCNSGDLTKAVQQKLVKNVCIDSQILGIDFDGDLINRANKINGNEKLTFKQIDVMVRNDRMKINDFLKENETDKFEVSFCFAITLWIHINNGDDGLKEFLRYVCSISRMIVIEPQEWKSYKTAVRRMKRSGGLVFREFDGLKMRENVVNEIQKFLIEDCGAQLLEKTEKTHWGRTILVLKCS